MLGNSDRGSRFGILCSVLYKQVNTCRRNGVFIATDPNRNTVLQQVQFVAQKGTLSSYRLHVLLAPHLGNQGGDNTAWVDDFDGTPLLFAQQNDNALALACSAPWARRSVGYVGSSDGWRDLKAHKQMAWEYTRAENGNVALTAEIDLIKSRGAFVLALGFGNDPDEAARNAIASLRDGFDKAKRDYIAGWQESAKTHASLKPREVALGDLTQKSLVVLRTHESKIAPGVFIASLAIPWGFSQGDNDQGGYHLVWSRDMVETPNGATWHRYNDDGYGEHQVRVVRGRRLTAKDSGGRDGTDWTAGGHRACKGREPGRQFFAASDGVISTVASRVAVRVIHTDEEWMIASTVCLVLGLTIRKEQDHDK